MYVLRKQLDLSGDMDNLKELNTLLLDAIDKYMDTTNEAELRLLEVLTDACMEVEDFLYGNKDTAH
jgi:hypothetical protein